VTVKKKELRPDCNRYCTNKYIHTRKNSRPGGKEEEDYSYLTILWRDPGRLRLSQGASLKPDESECCSPVSGGRTGAPRALYQSTGFLTGPTPHANIFVIATAVINTHKKIDSESFKRVDLRLMDLNTLSLSPSPKLKFSVIPTGANGNVGKSGWKLV